MQNYSVHKEFKTQLSDKALFINPKIILIIFTMKIYVVWLIMEASNRGASDEHPQHILLSQTEDMI